MYRRIASLVLACALCITLVIPAQATNAEQNTFHFGASTGIFQAAGASADSVVSALTTPVVSSLITASNTYGTYASYYSPMSTSLSDPGGSVSVGGYNSKSYIGYIISTANDGNIIPSGATVSVTVPSEMSATFGWKSGASSATMVMHSGYYSVELCGYNGSGDYVYIYRSPFKFVSYADSYTFTIPSDSIGYAVTQVRLVAYYCDTAMSTYNQGSVYFCPKSGSPIKVYYEPTKTNDLLGGILQWIKDIFGAITELPGLIIDGVFNLFVPSAEDLQGVFDSLQSALSTKLGAVYEAFDIVLEVFRALGTSEEAGDIDFPGLSLSIAGATFSIPAQSVSLWPGSFSSLQEPVRLGCTMVLVIAWVNGLLKRFAAFIGDKEE